MDIPYRKFFFVLAVIGPLFACALPNFAALAPTPVVLPTAAPIETAGSEVVEEQPPSAGIEAPPSLISVEQLPPMPTAPIDSSAALTDLIQIEAGLDYQISGEATVTYTAAGSRPFIVRLSSSAGVAQIRDSNGIEVEGLQVMTTATQNFYAVPDPVGGTFTLSLNPTVAGSMTLRIFDLAFDLLKVSTEAEFVGVDELIRSELTMSPGSFYVIILQPSAELDAVMELYGTAGIVKAIDDGGVGESELFFISPSNFSEWAIITYSYLESSGEFTLDIYEIP